MTRMARTFIAGFFVVLPIALTVVLAIWVVNLIYTFVGPSSVVGQLLITIGFGLSASSAAAYVIGVVIVALCIYLLGLVVESRLQHTVDRIINTVMLRIPVISNIYELSRRAISIVDRKEDGGLKAMRPVWCFFGGEGGAAVLALLPAPEPIEIGGAQYHVILVPSAPVPVGGCLIYVPAGWIKPADIGIEGLMSVYVSMGVSLPQQVSPPARPTPIPARQ
jgi:uncharacterized membrane protein